MWAIGAHPQSKVRATYVSSFFMCLLVGLVYTMQEIGPRS